MAQQSNTALLGVVSHLLLTILAATVVGTHEEVLPASSLTRDDAYASHGSSPLTAVGFPSAPVYSPDQIPVPGPRQSPSSSQIVASPNYPPTSSLTEGPARLKDPIVKGVSPVGYSSIYKAPPTAEAAAFPEHASAVPSPTSTQVLPPVKLVAPPEQSPAKTSPSYSLVPAPALPSQASPASLGQHRRHRPPAPSPGAHAASSAVEYNVLNYGAVGDAETDDSKAFASAWAAACAVDYGYVHAPAGYSFKVYPVTFTGPCKTKFIFKVDGTLLAPSDPSAYTTNVWLNFKRVSMTIQGVGTFNGQGQQWWANSCKTNPDNPCVNGPTVSFPTCRFLGRTAHASAGAACANPSVPIKRQNCCACDMFDSGNDMVRIEMCSYISSLTSTKTTTSALVFDTCTNVTLKNMAIINSQQIHIAFEKSYGILVNNVTVSAPGDSPNTDGIHLQNSSSVTIQNTVIGTGDDCISIQTGCFDIYIHNVRCGPGHGISVGGLGKSNSTAELSNVVVDTAVFDEATNGLRIKSWQGSSGYAKGFKFRNIQMINTENPILIDQYYCDSAASGSCGNFTSNVVISSVAFKNITGTSATTAAVSLHCSETVACTGITLQDINLVQTSGSATTSSCDNAHGTASGVMLPPSCLQSS